MDESHFDSLTRSLTTAGSRRRALTTVLGRALGLLGAASVYDVAAKKKKPCPPCKKRKKGKCKANLPDGTVCSGGACRSGSCIASSSSTPSFCSGKANGTDCGEGKQCLNGTCACPSGQKPCQAACVPDDFCCTSADCNGLPCCGYCADGAGHGGGFVCGRENGVADCDCECINGFTGTNENGACNPICSERACTTDTTCANFGCGTCNTGSGRCRAP